MSHRQIDNISPGMSYIVRARKGLTSLLGPLASAISEINGTNYIVRKLGFHNSCQFLPQIQWTEIPDRGRTETPWQRDRSLGQMKDRIPDRGRAESPWQWDRSLGQMKDRIPDRGRTETLTEGGQKPRTEGQKPWTDEGQNPWQREDRNPGQTAKTPDRGRTENQDWGQKPLTEGGQKPLTEGQKPLTEGGQKPLTEGGQKPLTEGQKPLTEGQRPLTGQKPWTDEGPFLSRDNPSIKICLVWNSHLHISLAVSKTPHQRQPPF